MSYYYSQQAKNSAFTPLSLPNKRLWIDFSDTSTMNLGVPPTDGVAIANISDKFGGGYNFTHGTSGNRPLYKTNIQNGLGSALFDGVDDYLHCDIGTDVTTYTTFVVVRFSALARYKTFLTSTVYTTNSHTFEVGESSNRLDVWITDVSAGMSTGASSVTTGVFYIFMVKYTSGTGTSWIGNVSLGTTSLTGGFLEGTNMAIGWGGDAGFGKHNGYLSEIIICSSVLSTANANSTYDFLKAKYAL